MDVERSDSIGFVRRLWQEEEGVTAIEYGLLAALIVIVTIVAFQTTGSSLLALYTYWSSTVVAAL